MLHTFRARDFNDLPEAAELLEHDLGITLHDGISLYCVQTVLDEVRRHNLPRLEAALREMPDDALIAFGLA